MAKSASLNHAFKLVWSHVLNAWVAVSEVTKGRGKSKAQKVAAVLTSGLFVSGALIASSALADPTGGVITSGSGSISQTTGLTTIHQTSQNLNVNWQTFNVNAGQTVNFVQPSSTALAVNRIFDTNGSRIMGNINANGRVWLINPNGVFFGQGSQVNVGSLLASTLNPLSNIDDATQVFGKGGKGSIINQGTINASNGYVAFIGNTISNTGSINATNSAFGNTVAFGAGSKVSLKFADNQLLGLTVNKSTLNNLAENKGLIQANGGAVLLSAGAKDSLLASVVNNEGIIEAKTVDHKNGKIILLGGMAAGTTTVAGTLDASASGSGGDGGFIETSAATVKVADDAFVTTKAENGNTGMWLIDPNDYTIAATGGNISGATLGGQLANTDITISTATQGTAGGNGDIFVRDNVTWSSGNRLTLNAERNIHVLATIDAAQNSGGKVALLYGQGSANGVIGGTAAEYQFGLTDLGFTGKINLQAGQNFSTTLGSGGTAINYTVITALGAQGSTTGTDLQGINGVANLRGNYVLGADIDASATAGWNVNNQGVALGFAPLLNTVGGRPPVITPFSGTFDGLGHTVNNLTINRPGSNAGLFGQSTGHIRHVGLVGGSVTGNAVTGALVGRQTGGSIAHVYSTINVSGTQQVGGLVGILQGGGSVRHASSSGMVSGTVDSIGGLIGQVTGSTVANSHATGNAQAPNASIIGGLVGSVTAASTLTDMYATGQVTGFNFVGGLVGLFLDSTLSQSFASGAVNGPALGTNSTGNYGGLLGSASNSTVSDVFATGDVNAGALRFVGGLAGSFVGGSLTNSYGTGAVMGLTEVGGLIGAAGNTPTLSNSFWNAQTTGRDNAVGSGALSITSTGNAAKTSAELQNPFTFIDAGWNFETVWGKSITNANDGNMQLRDLSTGLYDDYIKAADTSKTYGDANPILVLSGAGTNNVNASFNTVITNKTNAGTYNYSIGNVLNVTYNAANANAGRQLYLDTTGKLTINQAELTYVAQPVAVLQGQTPVLTGTVTGFVNGETLATVFSNSPTWTSTGNINAAGTYAVNGGGLSAQDANTAAGNYFLTQASANATALVVNPLIITPSAGGVDSNNVINGAKSALPRLVVLPAQLQTINTNAEEVTFVNSNFASLSDVVQSSRLGVLTVTDGGVNLGVNTGE